MRVVNAEKEEYINILVSRKRIEWIACTCKVSAHAEYRFIQRDNVVDRDLKTSIRRSPLSWKSVEDGKIYIAFDLYRYIVVDDSDNTTPIIVTFADARENPIAKGTNVFEMAMFEYKKFVKKMKEK